MSYRRRLLLLLLTAAFAAAMTVMARLLGADGIGVADLLLLACFALMLPWNLLGLGNAAIGLWLLATNGDAAGRVTPVLGSLPPGSPFLGGPVRARVAVLMPICEEDPTRVVRHLAATAASLEAAGAACEFFLLSDTRRPELALAEERAFQRWRAGLARPGAVHYRRRPDPVGHKTGNLWEWLERQGSRFDIMVVLDADSVMSGQAILRLVRVLEAHPEIGILQQLIVGLPTATPFPRLFQFGMRHGMRAYAVGGAWWQGDCGPYWGHNAAIRVAPFLAHCRLPVLPGGPPLGGRLLSHDQVEAVLMRRAGHAVHVVAEESGSYEENPPTLPDFIRRDLRWCQGNWQYLGLLGRPGLHAMGRLQLLLAMLMYLSGPAWVLFSLVGFAAAMLAGQGLGQPATLTGPALLGVPAPWEGWALLAVMTLVVFAPKLAGMAQALLQPTLRRAYGGGRRVLMGALAELLFSFVLAPIMAVAQTRFMLGLLAGRSVLWTPQLRDARRLPWGEAVRGLWPQTVLGAALLLAVAALAPRAALPWALLFGGPLLLAVPFAVVTTHPGLGRWLVRHGIAATPEELLPPQVVAAAGHDLRPRAGQEPVAYGPGLGAGIGAAPAEAPAAAPVD
ncbi:MAG: glucans biosynthesis glucosyltransferase MdoH [Geminicoccaceae bacterium]